MTAFPAIPFTIVSEDVDEQSAGKRATLTLTNGRARFDVAGEITRVATSGEVSFQAAVDVRSTPEIMPILEGDGPIGYRIDAGAMNGSPEPPGTIPVNGLRPLLRAFREACFAKG